MSPPCTDRHKTNQDVPTRVIKESDQSVRTPVRQLPEEIIHSAATKRFSRVGNGAG